MSQDPETRPRPGAPEEPEEIEILEIMDLDEGQEPSSASTEPGEVEVTFDEAGVDGEAPGAAESSRPALQPPPAGPEVEALRERVLRIQADFENLKRRVERERDEHYRHATGAFVARLLPVLDNLERALEAGYLSEGNESLLEGLALVRRQLLDELRREGLEPLESLGQPFDPTLHEAVATGVDAGLPPGAVLEEFQRGYRLHDRLLRPALVRVNLHGGDTEGSKGCGEDS